MTLADSDNERIKLLAVEAVRDMACTPSLQLRLAESGAVEAVADLLRPPSYDVFWLQTISKVTFYAPVESQIAFVRDPNQ